MHTNARLTLLIVLVVPAVCRAQPAIDFDRQVAPLLSEHCVGCHSGPRPKGGLDLASAATTRKGGKHGPAIVAGKPEQSPLWKRVADNEMPPRKELPAEEKANLKAWIASGARWGTDPIDPLRVSTKQRAGYDWWSLQPVRRPKIPLVRDAGWSDNAIDRFILERLEASGLAPSPDADRRTLIRRVSLDLLGLPPTWEETEAFLRDPQPDAYERLVDRLLASPHYGEQWARHWLDVVRYGESGGFERNDPRRSAWPYRDWIVRALNEDLSYDDFCRQQLAGDVLRPGDPEALRAVGYLVAGLHNTVLPNIKNLRDAAFHDELEDLVGNVGQTFLGMTANCARCHDHKFDPIPQIDYYRIASALSGVRHGEAEVQAPAAARETSHLVAAIAGLSRRLEALEAPARKVLLSARGVRVAMAPAPIAAWDFRTGGKDRISGLDAEILGGARFSPEGLVLDGKKAFARTRPIGRPLREKTLEAWVRLDNVEQRGGGVMTVQSIDGANFDAIVFGERDPGRWIAGSDNFRRTADVKGITEQTPRRLTHLAISYQTDGAIALYRDGKPYGKPYRSIGLKTFDATSTIVAFGVRHGMPGGNRMLAGVVVQARLYDRALTENEIAISATADGFVTDAELESRLSADDLTTRTLLRKSVAELEARLVAVRERERFKIYTNRPATPETMRVLHRGQVTEPGAVVSAGGLSALKGSEFGLDPDAAEGSRRIKLAEWINDPSNPLTARVLVNRAWHWLFARVLVNRLWHHHFGIGLVETPNDFGFNGGRPSHPELLDSLAATFIDEGFRMKAMQRRIVTSRTYRQASALRPEAFAKDADNRLVWRKRPTRIEGETLRDSMLAIAGLLEHSIGGPGFSDYKESSGSGTTYYEPYDPVGAEFHRRSLYRFQPRGANLGLLDVFDCPDPASAAPRRNVTTTPLQALALWNGPFALRMADTLADRFRTMIVADQATQLYHSVLQRSPTPSEHRSATTLVDRHGPRALARALFNSNEFLTHE